MAAPEQAVMATLADETCIHADLGDPPCSSCRRENWEQETSRTLTMLTAVLKDVSDRLGTLETQPSAPQPEAGAVPCSLCRQPARRFALRIRTPSAQTRLCVGCTRQLADVAERSTPPENGCFHAVDFGVEEIRVEPGGAEA